MQECDLIMKGGITSGVVYPHALAELAHDYRLRNIGGTSAGAIAAAFAAAAEYRRQAGGGSDPAGFDMVGALAGELGKTMSSLFQPTEKLRPLFAILIAAVSEEARNENKLIVAISEALRVYSVRIELAVLALSFIGCLAWVNGNIWIFFFGLLATVLVGATSILLSLWRLVTRDLPAQDFGICPGTTQPGNKGQGFADWIADKIDYIAGNLGEDGKPGKPLTVGQLQEHGIQVATMTTDLSSGRPYQLPLQTAIHYFSKQEFERILPKRVVDYLTTIGGAFEHSDRIAPHDLYRLPSGADFPVLLVARMSLSFPALISSVGLYRYDNGIAVASDEEPPLRRCLFTDGGISSNFPIHFFDALAPTRPTFGITLGAWDEARHGTKRVVMPTRGRQSTALPIQQVDGLAGFLSSILNTAKDWQDTMQSMLPGYAERIVEIRLDESREGGLNLAMDEPTITALTDLGREAGQVIRHRYSYRRSGEDRLISDFDQHRYNRAISLLPEMEEALVAYADALHRAPVGAPSGALTGHQVLTKFETDHYANSDRWRRKALAAFADKLANIGDGAVVGAAARPRTNVGSGQSLPTIDAVIRLIAQTDRVPRRNRGPRP